MAIYTGDGGDNLFTGGTADDVVVGDGGNDRLDGGEGADLVIGGDGDDQLAGSAGNDQLISGAGTDALAGGAGCDRLFFGSHFGVFDLADGGEDWDALILQGDYSGGLALGGAALTGIEGIFLLGADETEYGHDGTGAFSYALTLDDSLVAADGALLVAASLAADEALTVDGSAETDGVLVLVGGSGADTLIAGSADDWLLGSAGADLMTGGLGNDVYLVDDAADLVVEIVEAGTDAIVTDLASFSLAGTNVEDLVGWSASAQVLTGNAFANRIAAGAGADTLDGGAGVDRMWGGAGDDAYFVDDVADKAIEVAAEDGRDVVTSSVSFTLGDFVEDLVLTGLADIDGTGNALDNFLVGNGAANMLNGGGAADTMYGGAGNDVYVVDDAGDRALETEASGGIDGVASLVSFRLGAFVENLTLRGAAAVNATGNDLANILKGNDAANILNGGAGADLMDGRGGNDIYVVDDAGDRVREVEEAGGTDLVKSSVSFTLTRYVENLTLIGNAAIDGIGNSRDNQLRGNDAANLLNGGAGADRMDGGGGDDIYFVDNAGDLVRETSAGDGIDLVRSTASFTLGRYVENLDLIGSADVDGIGNSQDNAVTGNAGANRIDGGAGNDMLVGGAGNDRLFGGAGMDSLAGGAGADAYCFDAALAAANVDAILDFSSADDTIALDNAIFSVLAPGAIGVGAFRDGTAAEDADDRILYDAATGSILYDADGDGAAAAILFAAVDPGTALTHADFVVF